MMTAHLNVSIDTSGDDNILFRSKGHALNRVVVGLEEVELENKKRVVKNDWAGIHTTS
jgi:hypothetical protein